MEDLQLVNWLLAFAAVGAAVFAGLTYRQAKRFHEEQQELKRAMLSPGPETGHLKIGSTQAEHELEITLVNYGVNPTGRINGSVVIYDRAIRTRTFLDGVTSAPSTKFLEVL